MKRMINDPLKVDYADIPVIHNTEELSMYLQKVYIIEDILENDEIFNKTLMKILNLIRGSFVIKECREYPIKFKFYQKDKKTYTLQLRHFYINLILWNPFIELAGIRDIFNEEFIFDCDVNHIIGFINYKIIDTLRDYLVKPTDIQFRISDIFHNLTQISVDFSIIMGLNFSTCTILDMYNKNDEIKEIMEVEFDDTMQPSEIESELSRLQKREIELYQEDPDNPIGVILNANTGIKHKQFAEFTIAQGLKPTLEGITIPKPINNSTILKGLDRPSYYYVSATASRKSLVTNKKVMGRAGYFGKKVLLLSRTVSMATKVADCGSNHLVKYEIKSAKHLQKLNGKFFKFDPNDEDLKIIKDRDTSLIGKTVYVRSAATCKLKNHVCPTCVGLTSNLNYDIADGISAYESEEFSKVIEQNILSTKHLLTTNSEQIVFNKDFYKYFTITGGEISANVNNSPIKNLFDYAIYISDDDLVKLEEHDYDSLYNNCIANGRFYIKNMVNKDEEDILIQADDNKEIFLSEEANELRKKGKGLIKFSDLNDDIKLFEMIIMNKELTKPLYDLIDLLDKQNPDIEYDINSFSQKFLDLLIESSIPAGIISAEMITNRLIRDNERIYERPDFADEILDPYSIKTVSWCLENNESGTVGLSYQNIKKQLLSDALYTERDAESFIDPLFWTEIPTEQLKKYKDRAPRMRSK